MEQKQHRTPLAFLLAIPLLLALGWWLGPQKLQPARQPLQTTIDFSQVKSDVNKYLATRQGRFAVYYIDLHSGQSWGINQDLVIAPASCIKLPVVFYLYRQIAAGKLHWEDRVTYKAADNQEGAGALQLTARNGDLYSLRCLATIAITISDNVAHNMLVRYLGSDKLLAFMKGYGIAIDRPYGGAPTTARGLGNLLQGIAKFTAQRPSLGGRLIDDLSNTIFHVGLPGQLPTKLHVAHKEGSISGVVDDIGIVCSRRPYALVVLSDGVPEEYYGFASVAGISKIIYGYQQTLPAKTVPGLPRP